jgi:hypothetical protein
MSDERWRKVISESDGEPIGRDHLHREHRRATSTLLDRYDQGVRQQVLVKIPKTVLGAVLLGFGTIFQPKARLDEHWSTSPKIVLEVHASAEDSSDPIQSQGSYLARQGFDCLLPVASP